jgi:hypothetical protein
VAIDVPTAIWVKLAADEAAFSSPAILLRR